MNGIENPYENFIALSRYARWQEADNRRETWSETVDRYFEFMLEHLADKHNYSPEANLLKDSIEMLCLL
jgi:ribonucleoside-diphosphate reductase alpha chain